MDINAIITDKELHFRNIIWRMGQPHPIALDTCYTPWGFLVPMADNYAILETFRRMRMDTMTEAADGWRGAILTPENDFFMLRFYEDALVYSNIGREQRLYCVAEDSGSNSVAAAINMMNSPLTHPDFQIYRTPRQVIKTIEQNFPNVGDFMTLKRTEIIAELNKRFPKPRALPLHNDFKGKK